MRLTLKLRRVPPERKVFAAGAARAGSIKRVASAVGEGSFVHAHIGAAV